MALVSGQLQADGQSNVDQTPPASPASVSVNPDTFKADADRLLHESDKVVVPDSANELRNWAPGNYDDGVSAAVAQAINDRPADLPLGSSSQQLTWVFLAGILLVALVLGLVQWLTHTTHH